MTVVMAPSTEDMASQCYFATTPVCDMTPAQLRNVHYWWYATNMFCVRGKGFRGQLPSCVVAFLREKYPNAVGVPYRGFEAK